MTYIILDLEWNGAYSKRARGYFNEIIEIGAVKMDESLTQKDTFHAVIRPVVSRKLSSIVKDLTGIEAAELEEGRSFPRAISQLNKWISDPEAVVMTWSKTDLLVLLENCRYFLKEDRIPFINYYADLQAYCQSRMDIGSSQQIGLGKVIEFFGLNGEELAMHRALDDSIMSGKVFAHIFEPESFRLHIKKTDDEFYGRLQFKTSIISDINDDHVNKSDFRFRCEACNKRLRRTSKWIFRSRAFCADFVCRSCNRKYSARVQVKMKYDGAETNRKLVIRPDEQNKTQDEEKT
ncbi:MAG: exonuclease domain-containing protein [Oscillospiraceae bacterium]|nr:exonuclease domain-containing protein [Oscillospiraceae bacterium]MDD4414344.1 exonuclease domain-containing protein [Oscillospiraceae bacterium]